MPAPDMLRQSASACARRASNMAQATSPNVRRWLANRTPLSGSAQRSLTHWQPSEDGGGAACEKQPFRQLLDAQKGKLMARSEDQMLGVLLASLVHDAVQPLGGAVLMAGHVRSEMRHVNRMLARADRSFRALRWLSQALRYPKDAQAVRQPRRLLRALEVVRKKSDQLIVDIPPDLCVLAAPCVPELVLGTLLSNTRRYARGCRVFVQARVSQDEGRQSVSLTVGDDGPGISAKTRAQLFDPSAVSAGGGLGVGLWLAQQMLRCNGGDLRLDETARGSSFTCVWPFAAPMAGDSFPTDLVEFGRAVRKAREEAELTRVQLSERAGIAPSTVRNIETARHQPTATIRARLLSALSQP